MPPATRPGSAPGLVTIPDVELVRTGTWATSTGVFTFTLEGFAAAIAASQDPEVSAAPVKIGHTDPRFADAAAGLDGAPAFGWVRNLKVAGDRLLGDLVDVPEGLAKVIPNAYPRCSIEMGFQVHTPGGARYENAVVGLALLGVTPPAVAGLADVIDLYDGTKAFELAAAAAAQCAGGVRWFVPDPVWQDARGSIVALASRAGLDAGLVLAAVDQLAVMPPASSPLATSGPDTLAPHAAPTFSGGPMPPLTDARVRELLAIEANADAEAALLALRDRAAAAPAVPAPPAAPAATVVPGTQPFIPAGWSPPAPVAPVAAPPAVPAPGAGGNPAPIPAPVPAPVAVAPVPVPAPVPAPAAAAPDPAAAPTAAPVAGMPSVQELAAAVTAQLQPLIAAAAAPGAQVAEVMRVRDREAMLAAHARRGALRPADLDYYRGQYDTNPAGTIAHLAAAPVQFPTFELGVNATPAGSAEATTEADKQFLAACGITD